MRTLLLIILGFVFIRSSANDSTNTTYYIKLNFLYGSKPAKGYKKTESVYFGGLKGGHVSIEAGGKVLDFMPGNNPLLPNKTRPTGGFRLNNSIYWDTTSSKWIFVYVPVSAEQYNKLQLLFDSLSKQTPYDYAIFGMRCAAASYDVLSMIDLFPELSIKQNVAAHFYPKLLRKKILKWARDNNYTIREHEGRSSLKWESDKGML